ncbi:MAG: hypothetical protein H7Y42_12420 [Chitinophagaceae bacterium]|nr:hypothetical protein [Chitinophagaceae bacterium]
MQTKMSIFIVTLFLSTAIAAQQSLNSTLASKTEFGDFKGSVSLSIIPDNLSPAFKLYVHNPEKRRVELSISHKTYGIVVDTSFSVDQFNRRYNFDQAEDGQYTVILTIGKEKLAKTVEINTITTRRMVVE